MSRFIHTHEVSGKASGLLIEAVGEAGPGGATMEYRVTVGEMGCSQLLFQNGNPAEGVNGITNEVLLAIIEDRIKGFQAGPFACEENAAALRLIGDALWRLKRRTELRMHRGVEGRQVA